MKLQASTGGTESRGQWGPEDVSLLLNSEDVAGWRRLRVCPQVLSLPADGHGDDDRLPARVQHLPSGWAPTSQHHPHRQQGHEDGTHQRVDVLPVIWKRQRSEGGVAPCPRPSLGSPGPACNNPNRPTGASHLTVSPGGGWASSFLFIQEETTTISSPSFSDSLGAETRFSVSCSDSQNSLSPLPFYNL